MMTLLQIAGCIFTVILVILIMMGIIIALHYVKWFYWKPCKHCGHHMKYKGMKEDDKEGHYLFHCPHCGAWKQIPREVFLRKFFDKDCNPLEQQYDNDKK